VEAPSRKGDAGGAVAVGSFRNSTDLMGWSCVYVLVSASISWCVSFLVQIERHPFVILPPRASLYKHTDTRTSGSGALGVGSELLKLRLLRRVEEEEEEEEEEEAAAAEGALAKRHMGRGWGGRWVFGRACVSSKQVEVQVESGASGNLQNIMAGCSQARGSL
jgi:hypothetical protein